MAYRLLAALAALALTSAAHAAAPTAPPAIELAPCTPPDVQGPARCGVFHVPENYDQPSGRILALKVIVLPALSAHPAAEPVFFLTGGPGQAATEDPGAFNGGWERKEHDVVLMDLRGTGEGTALDCPPGGSAQDLQPYLDPYFSHLDLYRACRARLEQTADLTQYTTAIAMRDLDGLRRALGHERIYLEGGSYGTRAAMAYIHAYPGHVRAAVLSGLSAFGNRSPLYHAAAAQRAFDRVADQCAAEPACKAAYPDIHGDLAAVLAGLDRAPVKVAVKGPDGTLHEVRLDRGAFAEGLRVMLYSAESGRGVPLLLRQARTGDFAPFAQAALQSGYGIAHGLRTGMLLSFTCAEDVARIRPGDIEKETAGTFLGDQRVRWQSAACGVWPRGHMPAGYFDPFVSDVPVLLISGDLDPVTPPSWAEEVKRAFPDNLSLVLPGAHVEGGDCVGAIGEQLFRTNSVKGLDTACLAALTLPPFRLPAAGPPPTGGS